MKLKNLTWGLFLAHIFLRPFICQMCYPDFDIYYSLSFLLSCLLWLRVSPPDTQHTQKLNFPILLFITAIGISTFRSVHFAVTATEIYKFIPLFAVVYAAGRTTFAQQRNIFTVIVITGCLLGLYGLYQFFWGFQHILDYIRQSEPYPYAERFLTGKRVFAAFFSPNMFAGYLIMVIPLSCALLRENLYKKNFPLALINSFVLCVLFTSLFLTKSLGGWLSLFLALLFFFILLRSGQLRHKRTALFFSVFIAILTGLLFIRSASFLDMRNPQNSFIQRGFFLNTAMNIIKDYPLTGIGLGNFGETYLNYMPPAAVQTRFAHNSFLQIWAEMGILGLVAWGWLIWQSYRNGLSALRKSPRKDYFTLGLLAANSAFLLHNLVDFDFFVPEVALCWWVIAGLLLSLNNNYRNHNQLSDGYLRRNRV